MIYIGSSHLMSHMLYDGLSKGYLSNETCPILVSLLGMPFLICVMVSFFYLIKNQAKFILRVDLCSVLSWLVYFCDTQGGVFFMDFVCQTYMLWTWLGYLTSEHWYICIYYIHYFTFAYGILYIWLYVSYQYWLRTCDMYVYFYASS